MSTIAPSEVSREEFDLWWHDFKWRKLKHWFWSECLLLFVCSVIIVGFMGVPSIGYVGVTASIFGLATVCLWYVLFIRYWRHPPMLPELSLWIQGVTSRAYRDPERVRQSPLDDIGMRVVVRDSAKYFTLFETGESDGRLPGPAMIAILSLAWYITWLFIMALSLDLLGDQLSAHVRLVVLFSSAVVAGMILAWADPRAGAL